MMDGFTLRAPRAVGPRVQFGSACE